MSHTVIWQHSKCLAVCLDFIHLYVVDIDARLFDVQLVEFYLCHIKDYLIFLKDFRLVDRAISDGDKGFACNEFDNFFYVRVAILILFLVAAIHSDLHGLLLAEFKAALEFDLARVIKAVEEEKDLSYPLCLQTHKLSKVH